MTLEEIQTLFVMPIVSVDVRVQRPGVDQKRYGRTSARRISSIRPEMSERPLCPTPAAMSWRRPPDVPRSASIASRVSSDTVVWRRSAS
jgi:hypothetical protein